jgi:amino acid adenylation domain-containing protein
MLSFIDPKPFDTTRAESRVAVAGGLKGSAACGATLDDRFEQQADRFADRIAIHSDGLTTSYVDLNARANRAAHALLIRLGDRVRTVAVLADQGLPLVTGLLASLKAGRAFVPLDPSYPLERLKMMFEDSGAGVILTHDRHAQVAAQLAGDRVVVLNNDRVINPADTANPRRNHAPDSPAYILYTSGSTGKPKGVTQDHASVLHNMLRHREVFGITEHDRQTLLYPCSVYGGIRDIFNALLNGAALYHYPVKDAGTMGLADWLVQHRITIYCSVATVFRHFARELYDENLFPDLRFVKLGGEAPYRADIELFRKHFNRDCSMLCGLGSTETGITRRYVIRPDTPLEECESIPLGYAVDGMDIRLLDEQGNPVADGQVGEITVRSRYVMRGYHGRDDLNTKVLRDVPDNPGVRTFFTGDLGQFDDQGRLIHRGRKDQQVKVRGNRVELTEVEAALSRCAGVREAAVVADRNEAGDTRLIAYIVAETQPGPTVRSIRHEMQETLPHFMVPNTFVRIDALPQTPNGKVDRRALPAPDADTIDTGTENVAPMRGLEARIAEAWKKVLNLPAVGATDSFFDLGGDSLRAVQLVLEVERTLNKSLPLSVFYHTATVREMARWLSGETQDSPARGVICLNPNGTKPPIFCIPGRGGTAFSYRGLAALLDDDRPVYALQYPGIDDDEEPYDRVEPLSAEFIRRIRAVYPDGPVLLMGYSFGGLVAYEMAQQLTANGAKVPYLGLLDTLAPGAIRPRPKLQRLWLHLSEMTPADVMKRIRKSLVGADNTPVDQHRNDLWQDEDAPPPSSDDGRLSQALQRLKIATKTARVHYKPRPYSGDITLFKSSRQPDWMRFMTVEPGYGWSKLTSGPVHEFIIPGAHLEIFDAAHAAILAEQVRASLSTGNS